MNIIILDGESLNPGDLSWEGFTALGSVTLYPQTPPDRVIARIGNAEAVIVNKIQMTRAVFDACPRLRYVGELATGFNNIDLDAAADHGVCVTNVPAYSTMSVAQMVFALLLELCQAVGHHAGAVAAGRWSACPNFCFWDFPLVELDGKTMGIIGYGRIGRRVKIIAEAFGMRVKYYSPSASNAALEEVLAQADVLTLHCPLTSATEGMINRDTLAKMKDGAILLNTARGPLLVEADVRAALESGKLAGVGVDVVSVEPIREDNPLLGAPNCVITPHIGWAPREARQRLMDVAAENLSEFLQGMEQNRVSRG
ncbi:MAG: D-2-hydroxyacid dehydrogenase [Firmicutes bacterium]|nr:D-2-hydroxyacid dehydrogenase [Bacillota bacterium]